MTRLAGVAVGLSLLLGGPALAQPPATSPPHALVDGVVVRYYAPETGGSLRPRFVTTRTLAFEARLEALGEEPGRAGLGYQERHVRLALEHHIAEELLASLAIQGGSEPTDLPHMTADARAALLQRVGGEAALLAAAQAEGVDSVEVDAMLRRQARAAFYVDRNVSPILRPSEEQLREVYRTTAHPFKSRKFEEARDDLLRWFVAERLRVAEAAFLQTARSRVKIVVLSG